MIKNIYIIIKYSYREWNHTIFLFKIKHRNRLQRIHTNSFPTENIHTSIFNPPNPTSTRIMQPSKNRRVHFSKTASAARATPFTKLPIISPKNNNKATYEPTSELLRLHILITHHHTCVLTRIRIKKTTTARNKGLPRTGVWWSAWGASALRLISVNFLLWLKTSESVQAHILRVACVDFGRCDTILCCVELCEGCAGWKFARGLFGFRGYQCLWNQYLVENQILMYGMWFFSLYCVFCYVDVFCYTQFIFFFEHKD